jgi:hypothetical protein
LQQICPCVASYVAVDSTVAATQSRRRKAAALNQRRSIREIEIEKKERRLREDEKK